MRKTRILTVAAIVAVLAVGLAACNNGNNDNGTGGKPPVVQQGKVTYTSTDADGTEYKLVITAKAGRYVQQTGDTYVLTVTKDGMLISTTSGTITVTGAATITLSGGTDLTVTISTGGTMTNISGTIEDESAESGTVEAPGAVTPEEPTTPPGGEDPPPPPLGKTPTIPLAANPPWGWYYECMHPDVMNGARVTKGEVYFFHYTFKSNVAMDRLEVRFAESVEATGWDYKVLSDNIWAVENIKANTVYSGAVEIPITATAADATMQANRFSLEAGPGTTGAPILTFTEFELKKSVPLGSSPTITLEPNAPWGWTYECMHPDVLNRAKVIKGDTYTLTYSFKSNVAMDWLEVKFAECIAATGWDYKTLSEYMHVRNIPANTVVSGTIDIPILETAADTSMLANRFTLSAGPDTKSAPTLTFTKFELKKRQPLGSSPTITLEPNAPWGWVYECMHPDITNGAKVSKGETYTFTYSFKSNVAIDILSVVFAECVSTTGWDYKPLSEYIWVEENIPANTVVSGTIDIPILETAANATLLANRFTLSAGPDTKGTPILNFTKFEVKKK